MLGLSKLVACQEHRHTLGKQQRGEEITLLPRSQPVDLCVPGFALVSTVPAFVIVRAVAVFFAIRFVMFLIVTDQIANAEAIVRGYEVHARVRTSSVVGVKVATPRQTRGQFADAPAMSFPEPEDAVAILAVPFTPKD